MPKGETVTMYLGHTSPPLPKPYPPKNRSADYRTAVILASSALRSTNSAAAASGCALALVDPFP